MKNLHKTITTLSLLSLLTLSSCSSWYIFIDEKFALSKVECSENSNKSGKAFISNETEGVHAYTDDYLDIAWVIGHDRLYFVIINKSATSMKILWDEVTYMDIENTPSRTIHKGIALKDYNLPQGFTMLPKGAMIKDEYLIPTSNIKKEYNRYHERIEYKLNNLYNFHVNKDNIEYQKKHYVGRVFKILFPFEINGEREEYHFSFIVDDFILRDESKKKNKK